MSGSKPVMKGDEDMTMTLTDNKTKINTGTLRTRAMLAKLRIELWGNTVADAKVSCEIAEKYKSKPEYGKYVKNKINPVHLEPIRSCAQKARKLHAYLTSPWMDDGSRLIAAVGHSAHKRQLQHELRDEFYELRLDFRKYKYEMAKEEAREALNGLFNPDDYPPSSVIESHFSYGVSYFPVPSAEDFRVNLGEEDVMAIKQDIEVQLSTIFEAARVDTFHRIYDLIGETVDKLEEFHRVEFVDPISGEVKIRMMKAFQDSLVTNIQRLMDTLPGLNILEDKQLVNLEKEIRSKLTYYSAKDLKAYDDLRETTILQAQGIMAQIKEFF